MNEEPLIVTAENFVSGVIDAPRPFQKITLFTPGKDSVIPPSLDARTKCLPSSWQGRQQECVCTALAGWIEAYRWKFHDIYQQIDAHPIYLRSKKIDGEPNIPGTTTAAALQAAQELGVLSPVDADSVREIGNVFEVQRALHVYDVLLVAVQITDKWFSAGRDGFIEPGGRLLEFHMILMTGYAMRQERQAFDFQNSWGELWGFKGFGRLDYAEFERTFQYALVFDFKK